MDALGVACWRARTADLADKAQDNHGISAQKFHLLREFLSLGYRVLLSGARPCSSGAQRVRQRRLTRSTNCARR
jgi:hypothetical protein